MTGSTYRLSGPPETLRASPSGCQRDGMGLRRTEGFGDIDVVPGPWRPVVAEHRNSPGTGR